MMVIMNIEDIRKMIEMVEDETIGEKEKTKMIML